MFSIKQRQPFFVLVNSGRLLCVAVNLRLQGIYVFHAVPQLVIGVYRTFERPIEVGTQRRFQLEKQFKFLL